MEHAQSRKAQNVRGTVRTGAGLAASTSEKGSAKADQVLIFFRHAARQREWEWGGQVGGGNCVMWDTMSGGYCPSE